MQVIECVAPVSTRLVTLASFVAMVYHLCHLRCSQVSRQHIRMSWLGFLHGLRGVCGKLTIT